MKKVTALTAILLLQALTAAAITEDRETIYGSEQLLLQAGITGTFELQAESSDYKADYVQANLTIFPKQSGFQEATFTRLEPKPETGKDYLLFKWANPAPGHYEFTANAEVITRNTAVPVTDKVQFPLKQTDDSLKAYTQPSKYIDSEDKDIISLASSLAAGEDDQYVVVYKLAEWSNRNIKYDLSTLTESTSLPASWVLRNRQGVCDELTNLFIALNRALGIPARFVSGIAYTDSELFPERWGFHGWAEVYFPGYGWVPFDVTYGQFGFVDAGHIKMAETADISETTTNYQWKGIDIKVQTGKIKPKIEVKEATGDFNYGLSLKSKALKDSVGFGSYNIEEVEITNLLNQYAVAELIHSNTEGLKLEGANKRDVLLKPKEKKTEYFILRVADNLNEGLIYTFPLKVQAHLTEAETKFTANSNGESFGKGELQALMKEENPEKTYSRSITLECRQNKKELYTYETAEIACKATNTGNVALENLKFCHEECERFSLGITRSQEFNFTKKFGKAGTNRAKATVEESNAAKTEYIEFNVLDEPSIQLKEATYPKLATFNEKFEITLSAKKTSTTTPLNTKIEIKKLNAMFDIGRMENNQRLKTEANAIKLNEGQNNITITASFEDANGKRYLEEETITIEVKKMGLMQKIQKFLIKLF